MAIYKGTPTKDGRMYYFRKSINGKQTKSKAYKTKEEAEKAEAIFILNNTNQINKRFDLIADEFFKNLRYTKKESTIYTYIKDYNKHIYPYFNKSYINNIKTQDIKKWADMMLKKDYSIEYLNKIFHLFKSIFDFAIKNYEIRTNPVQIYGRFEKKKDKIINDENKLRYITLDDFNSFISVIDNQMWKTFFITLFYTGARKGEIVALTWKDIDFNNKEIIINKTLYDNIKGNYTITSTKNNKNRKIKMSKTLANALSDYKKEIKKFTDFSENWFIFGNSIHLSNTTINRYKHKYFKLANISEITLHEFRHSHVSLLINEYIKSGQTDTAKFFLMMSDRMGHTVNVMQKTYMHLLPSVQNEIVDLLDNL